MVYSNETKSSIFQGKRALVTGASSGIGAEFARQLAGLGCNLMLTARRRNRLEELAGDLRSKHGVDIHFEAIDLSLPNAPAELKLRLDQQEIRTDILINNAGFGLQDDFVNRDWKDWESIINLDIKAFTHMSHVFARDMIERGVGGRILQVGSIFSFGGVPTFSVYSGAKSYVLAFSEALTEELKPHNIFVTTLAPGATRTEFFDTASEGQVSRTGQRIMQTPEEVVTDGLEALIEQRPVVVSGWVNKLLVHSRRLRTRASVVRWLGRASRI